MVTTPTKFYCGQNDIPVQLATFQTVSDGKKIVANAITDKGIETAEDATFATMADNIGKLTISPFPMDKIHASIPTNVTTNKLLYVNFTNFPKLAYTDGTYTRYFSYQSLSNGYRSTDYMEVGFRDFYYHKDETRSVIFLWTIRLVDYRYLSLNGGPTIGVTEDYVYPSTLHVVNYQCNIINNSWVFSFDLTADTKDGSTYGSEYFYFPDFPNDNKVTVQGTIKVLDAMKIITTADPVNVDPILQ